MMKGFLQFLLLLSFTGSITAQINFDHSSFSELKAKAKKEHKLIYMDCYTTWCGPCKYMAKYIFTDAAVAKFYNDNFINTKVDMEAGEGLELANQFTIRAYPTSLFINENGEMVHKALGSMSAEEFVKLGKDAMDPEKQLSGFEKKYKKGNREPEFLRKYISALAATNVESNDVIPAYFATQKEEELQNRINWNFIYQFVNDYKSKEFNYLLKNKAAYASKYTVDSVEDKIYWVFENYVRYEVRGERSRLDNFFSDVKQTGYERADELMAASEIMFNYSIKDTVKYRQAVVNYLDKYKLKNWEQYNQYAYEFYEGVTDKELLAKAESWAKKAYEMNPSPEYTMDTYACLLYKNGKKQEAIELEKKAIGIMRAEPDKHDGEILKDMESKLTTWEK